MIWDTFLAESMRILKGILGLVTDCQEQIVKLSLPIVVLVVYDW